jgi:hypothetical protein
MLTRHRRHTKADTCGSDPGIRWPSVERVRGIEPPLSAWEADVLPLNYTRGCPPAANERHHTTVGGLSSAGG